MTITLQINGAERSVAATTVAELMAELLANQPAGQSKGPDKARGFVAVARNGAVVPRAQWAETALSDGDELEVVRPVPGG